MCLDTCHGYPDTSVRNASSPVLQQSQLKSLKQRTFNCSLMWHNLLRTGLAPRLSLAWLGLTSLPGLVLLDLASWLPGLVWFCSLAWLGLARFGLVWLGLAWLRLAWGLAWLGLAWFGLVWLGLAWLGLDWLGAWLGLAWLGLAWLGLAWFGLAWLGLAWLSFAWLVWIGLA